MTWFAHSKCVTMSVFCGFWTGAGGGMASQDGAGAGRVSVASAGSGCGAVGARRPARWRWRRGGAGGWRRRWLVPGGWSRLASRPARPALHRPALAAGARRLALGAGAAAHHGLELRRRGDAVERRLAPEGRGLGVAGHVGERQRVVGAAEGEGAAPAVFRRTQPQVQVRVGRGVEVEAGRRHGGARGKCGCLGAGLRGRKRCAAGASVAGFGAAAASTGVGEAAEESSIIRATGCCWFPKLRVGLRQLESGSISSSVSSSTLSSRRYGKVFWRPK